MRIVFMSRSLRAASVSVPPRAGAYLLSPARCSRHAVGEIIDELRDDLLGVFLHASPGARRRRFAGRGKEDLVDDLAAVLLRDGDHDLGLALLVKLGEPRLLGA